MANKLEEFVKENSKDVEGLRLKRGNTYRIFVDPTDIDNFVTPDDVRNDLIQFADLYLPGVRIEVEFDKDFRIERV